MPSYTIDSFHADGRRVAAAPPPLDCVLVATVPAQVMRAAVRRITEFRRRYPCAPLVLRVPEIAPTQTTDAAYLMQQTAARVLDTGAGTFAEWRKLLTDTRNLADDFVWMLRLQRPRIPDATREMVRELVSAGASGLPFRAAVASSRQGQRAVEQRLHRSFLSPPAAYHRFGGLAVAIAALAADPDMGIADAAQLSTYDDRATFTRAVHDHLGSTPSRSRRWIPWEWIAFRMELYRRSVP